MNASQNGHGTGLKTMLILGIHFDKGCAGNTCECWEYRPKPADE